MKIIATREFPLLTNPGGFYVREVPPWTEMFPNAIAWANQMTASAGLSKGIRRTRGAPVHDHRGKIVGHVVIEDIVVSSRRHFRVVDEMMGDTHVA